MKISCPSCSAKYSIADEKVQNRLAKIRCRKCGTSIVIDGNVSPASVYAAEAGGADAASLGAPTVSAQPHVSRAAVPPASGTVYTVDFGENDQRQMTQAEVIDAYNVGSITAETYLWADGFADWTPLAQIPEIVAALQAAARRIDETSAAGASTAPAENPWADSAASAAHASPRPAAATAPVKADLFGGIDQIGSEVEAVHSGSSSGGLPNAFGSGSSASATGARNESSVLFSLSALTSAAGHSRPTMPSTPPTAEGNDDSGLIDLKALTATGTGPFGASPGAIAPAPVGVAPLGLAAQASPLGAPGSSPFGGGYSLPPQQAKSNTGLFIGGGIVVAAVAVALIVVLGGKDEPPPPPVVAPAPVAAPAPLPPPMPTATALPTADPASEAKAPATGTAEEEPAPKTTAKKSTTVKKPSSSSSSSSSSSAPAPKPAAAPAPKKSGGNCGCAAGDLMCNMRCSSK